MKVAIIIPTMNRPDFMMRQFEFYEFMDSPHPIYISDSSNEENAKKLKEGIQKFKKLDITYQWAPPGKDYLYQLLPLVKEKYCVQSCDDDLVIPSTISDCADFLEEHPDYGTCAGKQINIRFRKEDFNKPYGIIERQTRPLGRSIGDENILMRVKSFWSDQYFICFAVTRTETEKSIRDITKHFNLAEDMFEFLLFEILIISGKCKVLDKLGYIMQRSDLPFFDHNIMYDFKLISEKWGICEKEFVNIIQKQGMSEEESLEASRVMFVIYLASHYPKRLFISEADYSLISRKEFLPLRRKLFKELKRIGSKVPFLKSIYYKFNPPNYVDKQESKYFGDYKIVKDFLESR